MLHRTPKFQRRGAAVVESALVLGIFFVLLFGVFEYCRFLMVLHVTNNAARATCRYATVNVGNDDLTQAQILSYIDDRMGGVDRNLVGYQRDIYPCTSEGLAMNPPQLMRKPNNPAWNQASFTERIVVTIKGKYKPVTPFLLLLPDTIDIEINAVMGSEG